MRALYRRLRHHPQVQNRPGLIQFVKFSMVGVSNTLVDFTIFSLLIYGVGLHYIGANAISFTTATTWSYILNRHWTFRVRHGKVHVQYFKFILVSAVGLGLTTFLLYLFIDRAHLAKILAKALAIIIVLGWNFPLNRHWTFRPPALAVEP